MVNKLNNYNKKRDFKKTKEPKGVSSKSKGKLKFVVQHHLARKDHYDFRLEYDGVLLSWAIPKGPSYNTKDRRLAVKVEDHPLSYQNFEGVIPKGEYGGGTVMLWDKGYYICKNDFKEGLKQGSLKFSLNGKRLKGDWTLVRYKDNNWLLIKESDNICLFEDIKVFDTSIKTGRTMEEIGNNDRKKHVSDNVVIEGVTITNPDKIIFKRPKITKLDIVLYYQSVAKLMMPYLENRLISVIRAPEGIDGDIFFKKHLETKSKGLGKKKINNENGKKEDYYYIKDISGIIAEVQMNSFEFHIWGSRIDSFNRPDYMVFDLDPDKKLSLKKLREGVKDLKSILDELGLESTLKTSGGKGYHVMVNVQNTSWKEFREIAKNIALLMEAKWPLKYTSNIRKDKRDKKIFIDWVRNTKGATSVVPYSIRLRKNCPISFPISWEQLDYIKPNEVNIKNYTNYL